jgi:beta-galactosidase
VDADKVATELPADGGLLTYGFQIAEPGDWEVWNRLGFEFARSAFDWRIDDEPWTSVKPDVLTTDLMEIAEWCEVAWLKLGIRRLNAGSHTLSIRLMSTKDDKGQPQRVLYASDALCLTRGTFHPNGPWKPDQTGRDAQDEEAARHVFELPAPSGPAARSSTALKGLWEVCRYDEQLPGPDVAVPLNGMPEEPHWKAIPVPGNKNTLRPDLIFAHRLWYRTRVSVPEACAGRSFFIVFPQNNLNTTVVVNGTLCGFNKNPFARFEIDITKAVKPGVNEVLVGIRDAWYGFSTNPNDPMKLRRKFNLPVRFFEEGFQGLAYPIWNHAQSGILFTPEIVCAGAAYTTDTFVQPSVARKELVVSTEVRSHGKAVSGELLCEAVDPATGKVVHALPRVPFAVGGASATRDSAPMPAGGGGGALVPSPLTGEGKGGGVVIRGPWTDPELWWPDNPHMYTLRTTTFVDGQPVDVAETPFGFREWTIDGPMFRLNGVVWRLWADLKDGSTPDEWLASYRRTNQRMQRLWGMSWMGMSPHEALDYFDRHGVVIRRSGLLDGERIGYMAIENDADLRKLYNSEIKMDLMRNWKDQMIAQVLGERNHPSIMIWSLENEWLYINCINLYGDRMDAFEQEVQAVANAVMAVDPTRPVMNDGGGAHKTQSMPVHGDHYVFDPSDGRYPDLAYEPNPTGGGRARWVWDQKRPRFLGEDYFATGINPFDYAYFGGERTFEGKAAARPAAGLIARMLNEGYRWAGYAAWHFWMGEGDAVNQYGSNAPRAVFCREWNWSFASGQRVSRTLRIYNDTQYSDPITFSWKLRFGGKDVAGEKAVHCVPPGQYLQLERTLNMPVVPKPNGRLEGAFILTLSVGGKEVFRDTKAVSVLETRTVPASVAAVPAGRIAVYDPSGKVGRFLATRNVRHTVLTSLAALPNGADVLIVGPDALDARTSGSSRLAAWASAGKRVIVLDQKQPLRYQGLPAPIEVTDHAGRTAFIEDAAHPACAGLQSSDFWTWGVNVPVYRNAYGKPGRGARSLIQCHARLANSGLIEMPVNDGLLLLCQLTVGTNIERSAPAQRLLLNLIRRAVEYRHTLRSVRSWVDDDPLLVRVLDAIGLKHTRTRSADEAIAGSGAGRLAIIKATPANLKRLASASANTRAFTESGGWIVLHGVTPEGLADFNRIVGQDHMMRPFRMERVVWPAGRSALTAGLTLTDIVMYSGERIFGWTSDEYLASDVFTHCVDLTDVAPFGKMPSDYHYNIVNGMFSADAWKYIFSFDLNTDKPEFTMELPKAQKIERMEWAGNAFYHLVTRVALSTESGRTVEFSTKPNNEPQTFEISPPLEGRRITLRIVDWSRVSKSANVVGIDNLRLFAVRPPTFHQKVRPLDSVGGMVEYPMGKGGIVLCNLKFQEREAVPVNAEKKRRILSTILANLQAPFAGGSEIIAGAKLEYEPVDISSKANQYRNERGWFGDAAETLKDLPSGRNVFAGVPFLVHEFTTSPVPTVIMLGGSGVPGNLPDAVEGIPVRRKAAALFFLHAARVDVPIQDWERRERKRPEVFRYIVHYADGSTAAVPIILGEDVDDYRQKEPRPLPGAQIAWTKAYAGTDRSAVIYAKQWNNPKPGVEISSLDLVYGDERRAVPALIAVTAAR